MGVESVLNLKTTFDLSSTPCRFIFEDFGDYASLGILSSNVLGNIIVTGPTGEIHSNVSWVTPDIDLSESPVFDSVLIPLGTNGKPYPGTYSITYTAKVSGPTLPGEYSYTNTFEYEYETPEFKATWVNNPYNTYLGVTDVTAYVIGGITPIKDYTNTFIFPVIYGYQNIVSNSYRIAITDPYYVEGLYRNEVSVGLSYTFAKYSVLDTLDGVSTFNVTDTTRIQDVYCCVKNLGQKMLKSSENEALSAKYTKMFSQATGFLQMMEQAVQLGQYSDADKFIENIYSVTDCARGCSCSGGLTSQIQPYSSQTNTPGQTPDITEFEVGDFKATTREILSSSWRFAIGQVELQTDYPELFAVIGTQFNVGGEPGGYFRFPDTRSRVLMGAGQGTGLTNRVFASKVGAEFWQGSHNHSVSSSVVSNGTSSPQSNLNINLSGTIATNAIAVEVSGDISLVVPNGEAAIEYTGSTDSTTLAVDFANTANHTDTISEAVPHTHDVTTTPKGGLLGDDNTFALDDTYTTTGHTVSINLDLAHSGTQDISHSHDLTITTNAVVTTPNIDASITLSGGGDGVSGTCSITDSLTLPEYDTSVTGSFSTTSGSTEITVQTVSPSLVVRFAIKVV